MPRALKKKGEVHTRRLWIVEGDEVAHIGATVDFPGIEMILRVDLEVSVAGVVARRETRHLITSLKADEVSPAEADGIDPGPLVGGKRAAFPQGSVVG